MKKKKNTILTLVIVLLVSVAIACGGTASLNTTPDTQSTVDAAIAATGTAQANLQATIDAAIAATATSMAAEATSVPSPTPSVEYVTLTEEELAALIDQAVSDATVATQECTTATTAATADDTVTQEEVDMMEVYVMVADETIAYAEELIYAYYDLYGELATETLVLLQAIEEDLSTLAGEAEAIYDVLQEATVILEQGLTLAEETITQLETAAQAAGDKAAAIQTQNQEWFQNRQAELENRAATALSTQAHNVAGDRKSALLSAFDYIDAVRAGLDDNKISPAELAHIAQLGANASAGLNAHGGPQLQQFSGSINDITGQLARGQMPQAQANLGNLERSLGSRPSRP